MSSVQEIFNDVFGYFQGVINIFSDALTGSVDLFAGSLGN